MTGGDDVVGSIAEGALAARAVEPDHGEAVDGHTHETACLNCGTPLIGSHCHGCGQAAHVHKTLGAFFHDLLHGVFHFEGKIWRTLPLLVWRPGRLTREYIDGRRASYVSPIALFLFSVFLMFAVVRSVIGGSTLAPNMNVALAQQRTTVAELEAKRGRLVKAGADTADVDRRLASERDDLAVLERLKAGGASSAPLVINDKEAIKTDIPWLANAVRKATANPELLLYKLQTGAYKYSWALIPLSVPFVWLLFAWRRRFGLYDHTVFVTYSLCFMTLLVVVLSLWGLIGLPGIAVAATAIPPLHMYRQLKDTYGLTRPGALWRTAALSVIAFTALTLFALALVALEVA
ncbi:uncharacterized protein DUF3667 [Novosphingobium kunmingense]|uniref:Uncharacterized protein DUF3667 n=1 Tax=Novosphingobium kunmingense TaxID=1211806 RepID=A0A2N0H6T8_9SPHN|nr:DUF3667 domain-containing protein [Novosphingobium kunmingense]PKB14655.1 uncharacterized protein DUF3667 [Novosphingobium kunmingense]